MNGIRRVALLGISIGFAVATGSASAIDWPPVRAVKPIDHSSPQAVAAEFQRAFAAGNWRRGFRTITADSQDAIIGNLLLTATFATAQDRARALQFQEVLEDYKISESRIAKPAVITKAFQGEFKHVVDKPRLFGKLAELLRKVDPKNDSSQVRKWSFSNFQMNGSQATANVSIDGQWYLFIRMKVVGRRWYVDMNATLR